MLTPVISNASLIMDFNWNWDRLKTADLIPQSTLQASLLRDSVNPYTRNALACKIGSAASAILLEAQLESIPQNITGQPKGRNRFFFDQVIPMPTPLTLPAWQSICDLWTSMTPIIGITGITFEFATCFIVPTLADSNQDTGSPGILPPTHAITMRDGYGLFDIVLGLWNQSTGWRIRHSSQFGEDVSVPAYDLLYNILEESDYLKAHSREIVQKQLNYWKRFDPQSDWNPCPAYSSLLRKHESLNDTKTVYSDNWGVELNGTATDNFERLLKDHGIGFRFGSSLAVNPWAQAYLDSLLQQFMWHNTADANIRYTQLEKMENQLLSWSRRYEVDPAKLVMDMDSIKDRLGL